VICLRPANAYGVGQYPFSGQGFVSTAMASVMRGLTIQVFGRGGTIRDYIYVSDLAAGIVKAMEHGQIGETYNVGSGLGVSNLDMVTMISPLLQELGYESRIEYLSERIFDVQANVLDSSKLRRITDWAPEVTLNEGLMRTREWLRSKSYG
jgi:UDP-glucose 4-epimerase